MLTGSEPRRILHGRHENQTIHDENGMRHYYEEWGRWMNRMRASPSSRSPNPCRLRRVIAAAGRRIGPPIERMSFSVNAPARPLRRRPANLESQWDP